MSKILLTCTLLVSSTLLYAQENSKAQAKPVAAEANVPVTEIKHFAEVFQSIRENYVDQLTDQEIMQAGLRGLLADIDPHSSYLSMKQAQNFEDLSEGGYAGIGIESDARSSGKTKKIQIVVHGTISKPIVSFTKASISINETAEIVFSSVIHVPNSTSK